MKIKYSGYNPKQMFVVNKYKFREMLERDVWFEVSDEVGEQLLKNNHFTAQTVEPEETDEVAVEPEETVEEIKPKKKSKKWKSKSRS